MNVSVYARIATNAALLALLAIGGCASKQVRRQHNLALQEVTELQYNQVLSNLAMYRSGKGQVPHFAVLGSATTVLAHGNTVSGGLNWNPTTLTAENLGFNGSRNLTQQLAAAPVTDAGKLRRIGCGLRLAISQQEIHVVTVQEEDPEAQTNNSYFEVAPSDECVNCIRELVSVGILPAPRVENEIRRGSFIFKTDEAAYAYQAKLIEALGCKAPNGWFGFGSKQDVPKDALYVGRFDNCYTWVMCNQVDALSRFTLTMLDLATKEPNGSSVEISRKYETPFGEIEIKGTASGAIGDFVSPREVVLLRQLDAKGLKSKTELSAEKFEDAVGSLDSRLPSDFAPAPSRTDAPLILLPQGLINTPGPN
ncbi:hypothetical protein K227x_59220 [Rubripirellula lacrimiformis]|uniref:Uncharacterized protein n=1 Tax=Rubripirellula lacrimiformis TaxID=1930273 RepID=A0A517NK32_9BACT|nr:hypothetical protein [Rubripirellula lacrimiformis]QDT07495.1 hypothetical protein K227x_59220 [Rubripirellula lacrimiformis]